MNIKEQIKEFANEKNAFFKTAGCTITKLEDDYCEGEMFVTKILLNPMQICHGGALYTLADTVAGALATASSGKFAVTQCVSFNYLLAANLNDKIICKATPEKVGESVGVFEVKMYNQDNKCIASASYNFFFKKEIDEEDIKIASKKKF